VLLKLAANVKETVSVHTVTLLALQGILEFTPCLTFCVRGAWGVSCETTVAIGLQHNLRYQILEKYHLNFI
jgi:hypothetical protein